jgi:hypothetical protein
MTFKILAQFNYTVCLLKWTVLMKKMVILKDVNNQKIQTLQKPDKKCLTKKASLFLSGIFYFK